MFRLPRTFRQPHILLYQVCCLLFYIWVTYINLLSPFSFSSILSMFSTREGNVFCKLDYNKWENQNHLLLKIKSWKAQSYFDKRMFGAKCFKCCRTIAHSDWVRRAREQVMMMMMMMRRRRMLRMMVMRWKKIVRMMELMVMMVTIMITRFTT